MTVHSEEFSIFVERCIQFMNLWIVYTDLLSGKYVPSLNADEKDPAHSMQGTLMILLYSFFHTLVEDSSDGLNGFRVWRQRFPEEEPAIARVEAAVKPFVPALRVFRNRLGFNGSRSRSHQARAFDLLQQHSGTEIWNAMQSFKSLASALLAKINATNGNSQFTPERIRQWIDAIAR